MQVNYNGTNFPANALTIEANNRGLLYGDAVFETMRMLDGKPCFPDRHMARLEHACALLNMELPDAVAAGKLAEGIVALAKTNGVSGSGRVRLTIMRNGGGRYTPETNTCSYLLECEPYSGDAFELNENGLSLDLYETHRKAIGPLGAIKSTNAVLYVLAGVEKKKRGIDRMLLLNDMANLAEEISSNVFLVLNGVLYTPSLSQGCLPGIMREVIIEIAAQHRIEVQECPLSPGVLFKADEVFLTNALQGIQWVSGYRHKEYVNEVATKLVGLLNDFRG